MKRNKRVEAQGHDKLAVYKQCVAFHEAGHAAGIHLNNQASCLPAVFFNINFKNINSVADADVMAYQATSKDCVARVEGGRLIESLPSSIDSVIRETAEFDDTRVPLKDYKKAFEADIINLLIGPLAEAKHVADIDDEPFSRRLINLKALKYYGGSFDLTLVNEYLQSYATDTQQQDEKLDELFTVAFNFVNNKENWLAITKLAHYILGCNKNIICCEEIISILDQSAKHKPDGPYCHI